MKTHVVLSGFIAVLITSMFCVVLSHLFVNKTGTAAKPSFFSLYSPANSPFRGDIGKGTQRN